ncbi:cupin [Saccharibacillus sp. O16]|nr:cupin [Saccharibacillus sp. O16]
MDYQAVNLNEKFSLLHEQWSPRVISEMNDYQFKIVKIEGHFVWHVHQDTDEVFVVIQGEMAIDFRDGQVKLAQGDLFVVPKGVEHKPFAERECQVMLVEPRGVLNTGDTESDRTAANDVWI